MVRHCLNLFTVSCCCASAHLPMPARVWLSFPDRLTKQLAMPTRKHRQTPQRINYPCNAKFPLSNAQQCSAMLSDAQWCSAMLLLISAQTSHVAQSRLCIARSSIVNLFSTGAVNFTENGWRSHVYLMAEHLLLLVVGSSRKWLARLRGVPPYNSAAYIPIMRMVYIKKSVEGNHTAMLKSTIWVNFYSKAENLKD